MSQSNAIAGFLIAAFLIFITARGKLPAYAAVFVGGSGGGVGNGDAPAPSGTSGEADKTAGDGSSFPTITPNDLRVMQFPDLLGKILNGGQ